MLKLPLHDMRAFRYWLCVVNECTLASLDSVRKEKRARQSDKRSFPQSKVGEWVFRSRTIACTSILPQVTQRQITAISSLHLSF